MNHKLKNLAQHLVHCLEETRAGQDLIQISRIDARAILAELDRRHVVSYEDRTVVLSHRWSGLNNKLTRRADGVHILLRVQSALLPSGDDKVAWVVLSAVGTVLKSLPATMSPEQVMQLVDDRMPPMVWRTES